MITTTHSNTKRSPWKSEREFSSFQLLHTWCFAFEWLELGRWHVPVQINDLLCIPPSFHFFGGVHVFLFFCLCSHNSVNVVIGILSMRLNEGSIQISSQMVARSLWEVPVLVLGQIFIEITRGPLNLVILRVFPNTFSPGGTQRWVGYGCATRSFDHHPITKPEKTQICNLLLNHLLLEGPFLKPISTFYHINWDA